MAVIMVSEVVGAAERALKYRSTSTTGHTATRGPDNGGPSASTIES